MDPCVTCGTTEETTSVCTCDCQCLETARRSGCREIKLIAPTRDTATAWAENDPIVPEGVFFLVKDRLFEGSLEYAIGDGESKYSELSMLYAGAPLSRTGAQNHSPLAASGKSTLDPSWLPAATDSALGAVMVSTTGAAGKVPIPASGATTLDSSWLPDATSSTKGAVMASTTTAANNVVKADASGGLDGWKDAIIDAIIADDGSGGLITDSSGNLAVDFSQMPTDKFEALLKSLKMLIPLETNLDLYVDTNNAAAADTIEDGRGTQAKPFKTIQAAVDYVTQTYAVNDKDVHIKVVAGTYNEHVYLPQFSRTSGTIYIQANSGLRDVKIVCQENARGTVEFGVSVTGGPWYLRGIEVERTEHATTETTAPITGCIYVGQNGILYLRSFAITQKMPTGVTELTGTESYMTYNVRLNNGGIVYLVPDTLGGVISMEKPTSGSPAVRGFALSKQSRLQFNRSASVVDPAITCSGSCDTFITVAEQSQVTVDGAGTRDSLTNDSLTGKRFAVSGSSFVNIGANSTTFPGDSDGTVDNGENGRPQTYCWYA